MSDTDLNLPSTENSSPEVEQLRAEVKSLQNLFLAGIAALLLLSGSVNFLLLWQVVSVSREYESQRPGVNQIISDYERISKPMITKFVADLQEYSKTHPGFQEVLGKFLKPPTTPAAPGGMNEGLPAIPGK